MRPCEVCGAPGQRHHIVFRSHGGLDIDVNYVYLCAWHHTQGPDAPHRNRETDLRLKLRMQRDLENMLWRETYRIAEIAEIIGTGRRTLARKMRAVPNVQGNYKREEIIKYLMGGKLYECIGKGHQPGVAVSAEGFRLLDDTGGDSEGNDGPGCCRFCGQIKIMHIAEEWSQEHLDEEATLTCSCSAAQAYAFRKGAVNVAQQVINQLFSEGHRLKWMYKINLDPSIKPMMLRAVDSMEAGIIDSAAFTTGAVDIKLTMRADGKIKVKWNYKDKGELEQ